MICFAMSDKLLGPIKHFLKNENYTQYTHHEYNLRNSNEPSCTDRIRTDRFLNFMTCKNINSSIIRINSCKPGLHPCNFYVKQLVIQH